MFLIKFWTQLLKLLTSCINTEVQKTCFLFVQFKRSTYSFCNMELLAQFLKRFVSCFYKIMFARIS